MRIAIGHIIQETNTFSPIPTTLQDLQIFRGSGVESRFRGTRTETGGFLDVLSSAKCDVIPLFGVDATTGGLLRRDDYQEIRSMILNELASVLPVDGVLLALHGAMCADGVDDIEGDLLAAVRRLLGPKIPLAVTLDLHANMTNAMVANSQIIVGYKTWPHVDHYETGSAAAQLMLRTLAGEIKPVTTMRKLRMILPAENMQTGKGPMAEVFASGEAWRLQHPEVLSVSVFGVQPWMDVAEMGCATLCVVDHNLQIGQQCVDSIAMAFWERREKFAADLISPAEAIEKALAMDGGPVVLAEPSDSPSSGATGDSAELLRELMTRASGVPAAIWICDPKAVAEAWQSGVKSRIETQVGGQLDPFDHKPLPIKATVENLSNGEFTYTGVFRRGLVERMGRTAVLRAGQITILISEKPVANISVDLFRSQQIEPKEQKIIVVKSPGGFRSEYEPFAKAIFLVDTPGVTSPNIKNLRYARISRPIYPLDEITRPFRT